MILYSINDLEREQLYSFFEDEAFEYLKTLNDKNQERIIKLITVDALKILSLKAKKGTFMTKESKEMYCFLKDAEYDEIKFYIEENVEWFSKLFIQGRQFYQLPVIDQCLMMRLLVQEGEARKMAIFDIFTILDGATYTVQKDLEAFNYYYCDYKEKTGTDALSMFYLLILRLMDELRTESNQEFERCYSQILKNFYMLHQYLGAKSSAPVIDGIIPKSLLENEPIQNAKELIFAVPDLFCEVLAYHLFYENNDLFDKEEIKIYAKKCISPKMKEKLQLF